MEIRLNNFSFQRKSSAIARAPLHCFGSCIGSFNQAPGIPEEECDLSEMQCNRLIVAAYAISPNILLPNVTAEEGRNTLSIQDQSCKWFYLYKGHSFSSMTRSAEALLLQSTQLNCGMWQTCSLIYVNIEKRDKFRKPSISELVLNKLEVCVFIVQVYNPLNNDGWEQSKHFKSWILYLKIWRVSCV